LEVIMLERSFSSKWTDGQRKAGAAAVLVLLCGWLLAPTMVEGHSASPFAKFLGSWRGSGRIVTTNGGAEKISCRADFSAASQGEALSQKLVCASDSYRFDIHSFVVTDAQGVQGHWEEATHQVSGQVVGKVADGQFDGNIVATGFSAAISFRVSGHRQSVVITPQGGDIAKVDIVMSRLAEL
jgi:hypothetical protein